MSSVGVNLVTPKFRIFEVDPSGRSAIVVLTDENGVSQDIRVGINAEETFDDFVVRMKEILDSKRRTKTISDDLRSRIGREFDIP